jgi:hypothetical protein
MGAHSAQELPCRYLCVAARSAQQTHRLRGERGSTHSRGEDDMAWEMKEKIDSRLASEASGLKQVKAPTGVSFLIKVDFDSKVEKAAMKDPMLRKEFEDAARETIDKFVELVGLKMKATDAQVVKLIAANKLAEVAPIIAKMNKDIDQVRGSAQQFGVQEVQKAWTELQKKKKEYLKYKIKIGVTIGAAAAGLVTSIALMAATPWTGGASAALSIIGMVKSTVTITKEAAAAALEVEQAATALGVQLKAVEAIWSKTKAGGHGNEIVGTVLTQFLGQAQPSIKGCVEWMGKCEQKLNGVELKAHDISKNIQKMMNSMGELEGKFMDEAKKRLEKHPSGKGKEQLGKIKQNFHKAVDEAEGRITQAQGKLNDQIKRIGPAKKSVADLKKRVIELAKFRGGAYKVLDNVLSVSDIALAPLSGNGLVSGFNDLAQNLGPAVGAFAIDKITSVALDGTFLA